MGWLQDEEDKIKRWIFGKELQSAAVVIAKAACSYGLAHAGLLQEWGVTASMDPNILAGALLGIFRMGGTYLAAKFPNVLGWLA